MRNLILIILCFQIVFGYAQNVVIPDANFKSFLLANTSINTVDDGEISVAEAAAFSGTINCGNSAITDLTGIEAFVNIIALTANNNNLGSVNLSQNTKLRNINLTSCSLSSIDVSMLSDLRVLVLNQNPSIVSLNVTQNLYLQELRVTSALTTLDLSNNPSLWRLILFNFAGTELDLSNNPALGLVNIQFSTSLTTLNLNSGNNTAITDLYLLSLTNLYCVKVDDATFSTTNWTNIDSQLSFSEDCSCALTIPDANFKSYLVNSSAINLNDDDEIQCYEATAYKGSINVQSLGISDMSGIESFINITELNCRQNDLTAIDISLLTKLKKFDCIINDITSLDVSTNVLLSQFRCTGNQLTTIDISNNTALDTFYCDGNSISTLDVSANTNLTILGIFNNPIAQLEITTNTLLVELIANGTDITSLDLSNNSDLELLTLFNSDITSLDVSANTNLNYFRCDNSPISSLNIANGNNINFTEFNASNTSNLTCIEVDDITYSTTNWTNIDVGDNFSLECLTTGVQNSEGFKEVKFYPNPTSDKLYIQQEEGQPYVLCDIYGRIIKEGSIQEGLTILRMDFLEKGAYYVRLEDGRVFQIVKN